MTISEAIWIAERDDNFRARVRYHLLVAAHLVSREPPGARQRLAAAVLASGAVGLTPWAMAVVSLNTEAEIAGFADAAAVPVTTALLLSLWDVMQARDPEVGTWGPRGPVGPAVPLAGDDPAEIGESVTVTTPTAAGIQGAITTAKSQAKPVVRLPDGDYPLEASVTVPAGITLLGSGPDTRVTAPDESRVLFVIAGDRTRLTRLVLVGAAPGWSTTNASRGVQGYSYQDTRVDHCELRGFAYGCLFAEQASAQVDHCYLHHNLRAGLGYGVMVTAGAWVLVTDCEFSQNRVSLASSGAIDAASGSTGTYQLRPGVRPPRWEFLYNYVHGDEENEQHQSPVDTHPSMNGTFVAEGNRFENLIYAFGLRDGSGLVRDNLFRDFVGFNFAAPVSVYIRWTTQNGIPVAGAMPREIHLTANEQRGGHEFLRLGTAANVWQDGTLLPETYRTDFPRPAPIPRATPMDAAGVLTWPA